MVLGEFAFGKLILFRQSLWTSLFSWWFKVHSLDASKLSIIDGKKSFIVLVPDAGDLLSPSVQMLVCQISATPPQQPTQRLSVTVIELRNDAGEGLPTFIDDDEDADDGTGEVNTTIFV